MREIDPDLLAGVMGGACFDETVAKLRISMPNSPNYATIRALEICAQRRLLPQDSLMGPWGMRR
jgi:hypothetical protein